MRRDNRKGKAVQATARVLLKREYAIGCCEKDAPASRNQSCRKRRFELATFLEVALVSGSFVFIASVLG
jgi:hypothetical protein